MKEWEYQGSGIREQSNKGMGKSQPYNVCEKAVWKTMIFLTK